MLGWRLSNSLPAVSHSAAPPNSKITPNPNLASLVTINLPWKITVPSLSLESERHNRNAYTVSGGLRPLPGALPWTPLEDVSPPALWFVPLNVRHKSLPLMLTTPSPHEKVFIARQHSNADSRYWYRNYCVCMFVRPSVRLSVASYFLQHSPIILVLLLVNIFCEIPTARGIYMNFLIFCIAAANKGVTNVSSPCKTIPAKNDRPWILCFSRQPRPRSVHLRRVVATAAA